MGPTALIGRDHPIQVLRGALGRTLDSHGGLVLVAGEAGIGKTVLVADAAAEAGRAGALLLSGTCWEGDDAPGLWPWVQILRDLRRADPSAICDDAAESVAALLGEGGQAKEGGGFPLYDAVTRALAAASHHRPVLVVLEDLHWADPASITLLEFAARHTWFERLLVVGTYRDMEVEPDGHPLRPQIEQLAAKATTVTLTGLGRDEVGALIARTTGREPEPELITEIHSRTGGNPFFVEQTARLWQGGSPVAAIAPGVRAVLRQRLSRLPPAITEILTAAAVLGREFRREVLLECSDTANLDPLLGQVETARLVVPLGAGRWAFVHDLVREALYDSIEEDEAHRRHAAAVRAIEHADGEQALPAELARHAYRAVPVLDPAKAVRHLKALPPERLSRRGGRSRWPTG